MALSATVYRLQIDLSDVDRNLYQALDLRVARHPSETMRYLLTRVLAYCLCYEEAIAFGKGLSNVEEPAVWVKDPHGRIRLWIDVGSPSPERLHKASKAADRVVVFTQHDPAVLQKAVAGETIHRGGEIVVHALAAAFLDAVEEVTERNARWTLVHTGGQLYLTAGETTVEGTVARLPLVSGSP
jgi:uncharacterized protein YaeQ